MKETTEHLEYQLKVMTLERNIYRLKNSLLLAKRNILWHSWWQRVIFLFKGDSYEG